MTSNTKHLTGITSVTLSGGTNAATIVVGNGVDPASLTVHLATPQTTVVNTGTLTADAGSTIAIHGGQLVNEGTLFAAGGSILLDSQITGNGALVLAGGVITAEQIVGSGVTATLQSGMLELASPQNFLATLSGWNCATSLDLMHVQATSLNVQAGMLMVRDGIFTDAQLHLSGDYASSDFHLASDAHGGTMITTTHT